MTTEHSRSIEDLTCDIEMGWDRHLSADLTIPDARAALKELVEQLESLQEVVDAASNLRGLMEQLEALREAVALAIEDVLLMDSPEGDSPRNIAGNLRQALASTPASEREVQNVTDQTEG